jgi:hypothetical protein
MFLLMFGFMNLVKSWNQVPGESWKDAQKFAKSMKYIDLERGFAGQWSGVRPPRLHFSRTL